MGDPQDSWENSLVEETEQKLSVNDDAALNVGATDFVPSATAFEFVPGAGSFAPSSSSPAPPPPPAAVATTAATAGTSSPVPAPRTSSTTSEAIPKEKPAPATPSKGEDSNGASAATTPSASTVDLPVRKDRSKRANSDSASDDEMSDETRANLAALYEDAGKQHLNIIFIGHVDAGKSTMGGQILVSTGTVDKRTMDKVEREAKEAGRESWWLSWALDTNAEERDKGKTIECGRAPFELENRKFTILDAPGHKSYVPHMISGAAQADVAILVISARKGEFETGFERGGQTREHALLAKTAGVKRLIVAVNKMDDSTVNWSKERYDECVSKITPYLRGAGYNPKTDLDFMPVSGYSGINIKDRIDPKVMDWYKGPSLLEHLDTMPMIERKFDAPLLMPIGEKYKDMGTVVGGKIEAGGCKKGDNVIVMPNKVKCEVLAVYEEEDERKVVKCGDNVKIRLKGIEEEEISIGFVLCDLKYPVKMVSVFEADLVVMEYKSIICAGFSCVMHVHCAVQEVTLSGLLNLIDKKTKKKSRKPPLCLKSNQFARVRFTTSPAICIETYKEHAQLGRFTLRDEGNTIAMGKVTKLIE